MQVSFITLKQSNKTNNFIHFSHILFIIVFDAMASGNGDLISQVSADLQIQKWKQVNGIEEFKKDLLISALKKGSAYLTFVGLITLVVDLIVESGMNAFLP